MGPARIQGTFPVLRVRKAQENDFAFIHMHRLTGAGSHKSG
jgi:hypothetical protein